MAASTGVASLAAHQVLNSIFFVGCKYGDAISQTSQAFLPACFPSGAATGLQGSGSPTKASTAVLPPAAARRLSRRLLRLSISMGAFVSTAAYLVATRLSTLFTSDVSVTAQVLRCASLLFVALLLHPPTMASEGLLIGSLEVRFLAKSYAANVAIFLTALYVVSKRQLGLLAVWATLAMFQLVRLGTFTMRLKRTRLAFAGASVKDDS